jgi:release factor glutamine methyltransferase
LRIRDLLSATKDVPPVDVASIVAFTLSVRKEALYTDPAMEVSENESRRIHGLLAERRSGRPLAYITGEREFFSERLLVDERVLIPRPETELLVEEALSLLQARPDMQNVMDMGTGSGAIGIVVAKRARRKVLCVDVSADALSVAESNARRLGVAGRIALVCSDLFACFRREGRFNIILANLPYVATGAWDDLMKDVKEHEPRVALCGGDRGLDTYKRFVSETPRHLLPEGYVLCEIDGAEQAEELAGMFASQGFSVVVKRDYSDRERIVVAHG